ncbi:MAG: SMI1/KNR4 family protein [Kofleriaceae bacterium]|nr:SMI1/KNR4 family protein [Kofleriaceae bacterium]
MSDLASTVRETLARLAANDRPLRRFGAHAHRYELAAPTPFAAVEAALATELPDDLRTFLADVGSGGAGPGYGWIPIARAVTALVEAPRGTTTWTRALPLAHVGCGYIALMPLDGAARGEVWIDARAIDLVTTIAPTFSAWYLAWLDDLARGVLPPAFVPPGRCALAAALSGYLGACEERLGVPAGELVGEQLREVLGALGPGAVVIAAESSTAMFAPGDPVDPCLACAKLLDGLADEGLARDVVAAGLPPRPAR